MLDITESIVQECAVGQVSYVINAADLNTHTSGNYTYADDTYIVIPASNAQSRAAGLNHVVQWAQVNNLQLNRAKSTEIIIISINGRRFVCNLPELPDIKRVTIITMLGVTITNHLSISEHITGVITKCAQSLNALKVLRSHGMCDDALNVIYKAVVIAKVLYAIPAWWGFTVASDRQKLDAFIRRGARLKYYSRDDPTLAELVDKLDETLFTVVLHNDDHVLRYILPDHRRNSHCHRPKRHNNTLIIRRDSRNYFQRRLFKDMY